MAGAAIVSSWSCRTTAWATSWIALQFRLIPSEAIEASVLRSEMADLAIVATGTSRSSALAELTRRRPGPWVVVLPVELAVMSWAEPADEIRACVVVVVRVRECPIAFLAPLADDHSKPDELSCLSATPALLF